MSTASFITAPRPQAFAGVFPSPGGTETRERTPAGPAPASKGGHSEPKEDRRLSFQYPPIAPDVPQAAGADLRSVPAFSRLWQTKPLPTIPEDTMGPTKSFAGEPIPGEYKPEPTPKAGDPAIIDQKTLVKLKLQSQSSQSNPDGMDDENNRLTVYPQESSAIVDEKNAFKRSNSIYQIQPDQQRKTAYDRYPKHPSLTYVSDGSTDSLLPGLRSPGGSRRNTLGSEGSSLGRDSFSTRQPYDPDKRSQLTDDTRSRGGRGISAEPVSYKYPSVMRGQHPRESASQDPDGKEPLKGDERKPQYPSPAVQDYQSPGDSQPQYPGKNEYPPRPAGEYEYAPQPAGGFKYPAQPTGKYEYPPQPAAEYENQPKPPGVYRQQPAGPNGFQSPSDRGYRSSEDANNQEYQQPRDQRYQPSTYKDYQSPMQQGYQPPREQRYQPQRDQRYQPPGDVGYQPPTGQGYQQPRDERYQLPSDQGYQPPEYQGYQPPPQGPGYQPPEYQGYQPPPQGPGYQPLEYQGYQPPPRDPGYQPVGDQGYQPPRDQGYQAVSDQAYRSSRDREFKPPEDLGYQRTSNDAYPPLSFQPGDYDSTRDSGVSNTSQIEASPAGITPDEQRPMGGRVDRRAITTVREAKAAVDASERGQTAMMPQRRSMQVKVFRRVYSTSFPGSGSSAHVMPPTRVSRPLPIGAVAAGDMDVATGVEETAAAISAYEDTEPGPGFRRLSRRQSRMVRASVSGPPSEGIPEGPTPTPADVTSVSGAPTRGTAMYVPKPMYTLSGTVAAPYEVLVGKRLFAPPDEVYSDDRRSSATPGQLRDDSVSSTDSYLLRATAQVRPVARKFLTGSSFEGGWGPYNNPEQYGILILPHKVEYEGQFMDGMCHGEGSLVYPNGARVMGIWNRGRLVEMTYVAANAQNYDPNGDYCNMPDRRFHREILFGLRPACRSLLTDEEPPARPVPNGCYDAGDGIFDPITNVVYDPITITVVRVPTTTQREWIIKHCRKGWDENVGYRPDLFEEWVDKKPDRKAKKSDTEAKIGLTHHIKMERRMSPSIGSAEESEQEGETPEEPPEIQVVEEPEEPPPEESAEKKLERQEERFLQEVYPPAFTEDVLIRAPPPKAIDDMLFPDLAEEESEVEEEETKLAIPKDPTGKMTARERKMLLKAQKMKDEMTEQQKLELAEKERLEQETKQKEKERLRRLREKYTPKWPTAAKLMAPVLEESLMERQERRRKIEEAMAKEQIRRQEMEEMQQAATEAARLAREEEEASKMYELKEEPKEKKKKKKPKESVEEKGEEDAVSPRLSLDEEERTDEYHGPWRHVAKRLVPHLRERIEGDREAAAAKWQDDLMQLLSERASTAGLEMSTTGFLGATAPPPEEERKRGSSMRIFPPGLEERARKRRAEREAREMAEAREFAAQQARNPSVHSVATSGIKPSTARGVSIAPSGGSLSKKTDRGSATGRRVSINTDRVRSSPPEEEVESHHGSTSAGPMPSIKTSIASSRTSKPVRKVTHKEEDEDDDE